MWNWPMMNFDAITRCFEHEIHRRPTDRREVIKRMSRIFFCTRISPITRMHVRVGTLTWGLLNENDTNEIKTDSTRSFVNTHCWTGMSPWIFLNTNNADNTNLFGTRFSPITRMHVRVGTLTWALLNENDTNEIKTDSIRSFVNTHCLRLVLKVVSFYSFSPTIGKKAFIVLTYRKGTRTSLLYIFIFKAQRQRFFSEINP